MNAVHHTLAAPAAMHADADREPANPARRHVRPHEGMPPLDVGGPALSYFEFWPMWVFYPPIMAYAAWLMLRHRGPLLPTVANPSRTQRAASRMPTPGCPRY